MRLVLVRHGQTAANRELRYQGTRDEPLTEAGHRQAAQLARLLAPLPIDGLLTSPARRCLDTARPIAAATGLEPAVDPRLREQAYGEWEGLTPGEIAARGARDRAALARWQRDIAVAPPGGESLARVEERVLALVAELADRRAGQWLVLVSHVGPIKALLCSGLGLPLAGVRRLFLDPATVTVLDWGDAPVLRLLNAWPSFDPGAYGWLRRRGPDGD